MYCHALSDLSCLSSVPHVTALTLGADVCSSSNDSVQDLKPLTVLQGLRELKLINCDELRNLDPLLEIPMLRNLDVKGCRYQRFMTALAELEKRRGMTINR